MSELHIIESTIWAYTASELLKLESLLTLDNLSMVLLSHNQILHAITKHI